MNQGAVFAITGQNDRTAIGASQRHRSDVQPQPGLGLWSAVARVAGGLEDRLYFCSKVDCRWDLVPRLGRLLGEQSRHRNHEDQGHQRNPDRSHEAPPNAPIYREVSLFLATLASQQHFARRNEFATVPRLACWLRVFRSPYSSLAAV